MCLQLLTLTFLFVCLTIGFLLLFFINIKSMYCGEQQSNISSGDVSSNNLYVCFRYSSYYWLNVNVDIIIHNCDNSYMSQYNNYVHITM